MDVPRAVVLLAPPVATGLVAAGLFAGWPTELVFPLGLAVAVPLGTYATLRLRADLVLPLALLALAHALVFTGMTARCASKDCLVLQALFDAFHVGAFAAALAAPMMVVASAFAKPLRARLPYAVGAVAASAAAFGLLALGWALR